MAINLILDEVAAENLRADYKRKEQSLEKELQSVRSILKQLEGNATPSGNGVKKEIDYSKVPKDYPINGVWQDKVKYILSDILHGTTTEIVERMLEIEPHLDKRKAVGSVSAVLSTHSKEGGAFEKHQNERKEFVYWVTADKSKNETVLNDMQHKD